MRKGRCVTRDERKETKVFSQKLVPSITNKVEEGSEKEGKKKRNWCMVMEGGKVKKAERDRFTHSVPGWIVL